MSRPPRPKNPQAAGKPALDGTDLAILAELVADGRITNAALARRVGVAESTCIHRVRALREAGVVSGIHAHLDLARLGRPIQALVKVRLANHNRDQVVSFHRVLTGIPGMLTAFHVAGEDDYLLHVAVESPEALRDLVLEHVNVHHAVRHTETQLVFEALPGRGVLPEPAGGGGRHSPGR